MSIFEDTNPRALKELLAQVHARAAVLPDFQRDFVWDPSATAELIVSIAQNFPAGSLLRIRNTKDLFACREFQGAPPLNGHKSTYLVLDGQQRLTSLYQAFYGVGDHRYFLDVRKLLDDHDVEECLFYMKSSNKTAKAYEQLSYQAKDLVMPLRVLANGAGGFAQWTMDVAQHQNASGADTDAVFRTLTALGEVGKRWIQTIDDYQFPVVTLSDATSAESVCTIFETLNRTGVKLSPFELLTARFWPMGINLRSMWAAARESYPIIEDFGVDPYHVMQSLSLVARRTPSCKRGDVLELSAEDIRAWWDRVIDGWGAGLALIRDYCGVMVPQWLPSVQLLIPLGAMLAKLGEIAGPAHAAAMQKLTRWYWCSVFGQTYDQAPNTQAANDLTATLAWIEGGDAPQTVGEFSFDSALLAEITPKQRALYKGVISLILRHGPNDFHKGVKLTSDLILEGHIDDHHIFPDNFLKKRGVEQTLRNCVLNRTLIDRTTNQRISDCAPSAYMQEIRKALGTKGFAALLESHLLPAGGQSPIWADAFEDFLAWRREALARQIEAVTGLGDHGDSV